jgi:MEDS: MEthanogen/methylotroph, DcmR Sensory domain
VTLQSLERAMQREECEHMAVLLKSVDELPDLLVAFYQLGETRNGWLVHGSLPGHGPSDRAALIRAGLDVERLELEDRFAILELDLSVTPEEFVAPWSVLLDERMSEGFDALWFARFPIGPTDDEVEGVVPFEGAWMRCFTGRRVVTLCPYILGELSPEALARRRDRVASVHDSVVLAER